MTELDEIRSQLPDELCSILNLIWRYCTNEKVKHIPAHTLHSYVGKTKDEVISIIKPLGNIIKYEAKTTLVTYLDAPTYRLTFPGILLTDDGERTEQLLAKYLTHVKEQYLLNPAKNEIDIKDVQTKFMLSEAEINYLAFVLPFTPFRGSHYLARNITFFPRVDDLTHVQNLQAYIQKRALEEFSPSLVKAKLQGMSKFGIPGHESFENRLAQTVIRAKVVSVIFLDLDNFKLVNDNHNHSVGDQVIREALAVVQDVIRGKGELFHRSGDEMLVLLPNFDESEACSVGERIRRNIKENSFSVVGNGFITATLGISTYPDICQEWEDLETAADIAAMRAKKRGKNLVLHYSTLISSTEEK